MAALNEASPDGAYAPIRGNDGFFSSRRGSIFLDEDCIVYFNKWDVVNKGEFETTFNLTTVPVLRAYPKPCDLRPATTLEKGTCTGNILEVCIFALFWHLHVL